MARGARRLDFSSHIKARLRALKLRLTRRQALIETVRDANATLEPQKVSAWLVRQADEWIPAPCWAVVAPDVNGQLTVLADKGLMPSLGPSVWAIAQWVAVEGTEFLTGDLAADRRAGGQGAGSAIGLPLISRNRTIGVLIALDPLPSASTPSLAPLGGALGILLEAVALALDNALALQKAEALSVTDDLTGLANSRYLNLVLRREEKRSIRGGRPLSVLFIDMDGFKNVNTNHGHMAGSKALVEAAAVIRGCARETDVVARFGGDEFAVILPDTPREGSIFVAQRICERLRAFKFLQGDGLEVHLTASVGIAVLPDVTTSAEELIRAADRAMYQVKNTGKDGIYVAEKGT